jgi:hypothetical protein
MRADEATLDHNQSNHPQNLMNQQSLAVCPMMVEAQPLGSVRR